MVPRIVRPQKKNQFCCTSSIARINSCSQGCTTHVPEWLKRAVKIVAFVGGTKGTIRNAQNLQSTCEFCPDETINMVTKSGWESKNLEYRKKDRERGRLHQPWSLLRASWVRVMVSRKRLQLWLHFSKLYTDNTHYNICNAKWPLARTRPLTWGEENFWTFYKPND